jgi:serine/threonine-protein kinase
MSPEHFVGDVDPRSDIWALGATLYFMLTGRHPFSAETIEGLRELIVHGAVEPLRAIRPDVPPEIEAIVARCMHKDRYGRFQNVGELVQGLRAVAVAVPASSRPSVPFSTPTLPFDVGRYTVLKRLAAGGMGTVYLGRARGALGFKKPVAIKHLHPHLANGADARRRFLEEARIASLVEHPNVVQVIDVVTHDEHIFLVMQYVHGESLHGLLRAARSAARRPLLEILSAIFVDVAEALHAAHGARGHRGEPLGLVHRDVSPHNILVASHGAAYATDFGIAKLHADGQTTTGVMGKAGYMAPEQLRGGRVTPAADVFALGVVMWEALALERLFASDEWRIAGELRGEVVRPPSSVRPDVPPALDELIASMLARDPAARPPSAHVVAERIKAACPPASAQAVGAWVAGLATEKLASHTSALDGAALDPGPTLEVPALDGHTATLNASSVAVVQRQRSPRSLALAVAAAASISAAVTVGVTYRARHVGPPVAVAEAASLPPAAAVVASATFGATAAEPSAVPPPSVADTPSPSAVVPAAPRSRSATPAGRSPARRPASAPRDGAATAQPSASWPDGFYLHRE